MWFLTVWDSDSSFATNTNADLEHMLELFSGTKTFKNLSKCSEQSDAIENQARRIKLAHFFLVGKAPFRDSLEISGHKGRSSPVVIV